MTLTEAAHTYAGLLASIELDPRTIATADQARAALRILGAGEDGMIELEQAEAELEAYATQEG